MAILISDVTAIKPKDFSQSKDPVFFQLKSTSTQPWAGTKCTLRLTFTGGVSHLNLFVLSSQLFGQRAFVFLNAPYDSGWYLPSYVSGPLYVWLLSVAEALRTNPFVANYYTVVPAASYIDVIANDVGVLYDITTGLSTSANITPTTILNGTDGYFRDNFRLRFSTFCQRPNEVKPTLRTISYSAPDPDVLNRHNLQELLDDQLAFDMHPFSEGLLHDRSAKWYVNIDEYYDNPPESHQVLPYMGSGPDGMFVYRGGSSRLNTANFDAVVTEERILKPHNRTSQPASRGYNGRYFASYINVGKVSMVLMAVYTLQDGTTDFVPVASYMLPVYGAIYATECSPFLLAQLISTATSTTVNDTDILEYSLIPIFDGVPSLFEYVFQPVPAEFEQQVFWFESSNGVTETVVCRGDVSLGIEVSKDEFRLIFPDASVDEKAREVYQRTNHFLFKGEVFSGYMPMDELRDFYIDLLISENVWTHGDFDGLYRVHIDPDSFSLFRKDDALFGVAFKYKRTHYHKAYSNQL